MARGWESKSVEAQQADRESRGPKAPSVSSETRERDARRQTIALALARARADLAAAVAPAHRDMLERAIATLRESLGSEDDRK